MSIPYWPQWLTDMCTDVGLEPGHVRDVARATLAEDLQWGPDVTTNSTLPAHEDAVADVATRKPGCLAGVPVAAAVAFEWAHQEGADVDVEVHRRDGERVEPGDVAMTVRGPVQVLLTAERSLLNLLCQLSGVATATAAWEDALAGTGARVRDSRKTIPGLRILQKYAVRCGGGVNHRMGLGDEALIKDNHVAAAGSVRAAIEAVRANARMVPIEVECDTVEQVAEAIAAGAPLVLLDNMSDDDMRRAVALAREAAVRTEASGGLTLDRAAAVAATGVDYMAVGGLTHSAPALDLGMDLR